MIPILKPLRTSATDIETCDPKADGCYRKWYLKKVAKLPELPTDSTVFGDVLHAVCERFLLADENGDFNGKPVVLYPEGWEFPINRYTGERAKEGISFAEQCIINNLISKAISEGILTRVPGREIERQIQNFPIMEGVTLNGFIDLLEPNAIRDHKSTKSMTWAKSIKPDAENSLYKNIQLMVYAYWYYTKGGHSKSKPVALSHQYFVKDATKPHVEKREISVTWPEVEAFFKGRIAPTLEMMLTYRDCEKYSDIPLPVDVAAACRKFGGCPFTKICTEQETVNDYRKRIEAQISGTNNTNYALLATAGAVKGEEQMSTSPMLDKIKAMQAAKKGGTPAPVASAPATPASPPAPTPAPVVTAPAPAPASTPTKPRAPWYNEVCSSCRDNDTLGLNSKGTGACKICDSFNRKAGIKTSDAYTWSVMDGKLLVGDMVLEVTAPVTAKEVVAQEAPAPAPEVATFQEARREAQQEEIVEVPAPAPVVVETAPAPVVAVEPAPASDTVFEGLEISTEREKFSILIGCVIAEGKVMGKGKLGSPSCRITGEELMVIVEQEMLRISPAWATMNGFAKRDALQGFAKDIALLLGASTLIITRLPRASLLEAVVMGIRPYAGCVIQALAE